MKKIIMIIFLLLTACTEEIQEKQDVIHVITKEKTIENSENLDITTCEYLAYEEELFCSDIQRTIYKVDKEQRKEVAYQSADQVNLEVGEYELEYQYHDEKEIVKVKVVDTTPPEILYLEQRTFLTGSEPVDPLQLVSCFDNSEVEVSLEGTIDFNTPGDYYITFTAIDSSGNKTVKEIDFNVMNHEDMVQYIGSGGLQ